MILSIRGLEVSYLVNRYIVEFLKETTSAEEVSRYLKIAERGSRLRAQEYPKLIAERLRSVAIEYEKTGYVRIYALNGINLDVEEGKILACVGESGCGKSTLALSILRILPHNARASGSIVFDGRNIMSLPEPEMLALRARRMGYIGQGSETYLNPMLSNAFQIFESSVLAGDNIEEAYELFIKAIKESRLSERVVFSYPFKLSGGEARRVAFAMALAKNPKLLVCDEPFRNLDPYLALRLAKVLRRMIESFKTTAIIFTHNISLMAETADEIAIMYQGIIVEKGDIVDVFKHPYHPYTKGLIGALPDPRKPKASKLIYVPGEPFPRIIKPSFCPFFNRCPTRTEECLQGIPDLRPFDGRLVACHRIDEVYEMTPHEFWASAISF